jgi:D-alanyl-D-alanine carboxypeptidase (penicillin-binding protein 5/6)
MTGQHWARGLWIALGLTVVGAAAAQQGPLPEPPRIEAGSYVLLDYATGDVLAAGNPDAQLGPASLTKLMTAYIVFDAVEAGLVALDEQVYVSERAWRMRGSRMFIEVDTHVSVGDLLQGLIVQSGNDASVALAEHLAGSEEAFVEIMNEYAARLGMANTVFKNSMGLSTRGHYSSARDLAMLARALITDFPQHYGFYSQREYTYNNIIQCNRNRLLRRDPTVDGLKTGYTSDAGYCLVSSAMRDGMRLIAVVMGMETPRARTEGSQALLEYGFEHFETHKLFAEGEPVTEARVWKGQPERAALGLVHDVYVTIPRRAFDALSASLQVTRELIAPLDEYREVGAVTVSLYDRNLYTEPLVALHPVTEGGLWTRVRDGVMLWLEDD